MKNFPFFVGIVIGVLIFIFLARANRVEEKAPLSIGGTVLPHVQDKINECLGKGQAWEARISGSANGPIMLTLPRCIELEETK